MGVIFDVRSDILVLSGNRDLSFQLNQTYKFLNLLGLDWLNFSKRLRKNNDLTFISYTGRWGKIFTPPICR